jgi:hypothetical protein
MRRRKGCNIEPRRQIKKKQLSTKNSIKPEIGGPPGNFSKSLEPPGKNMSYPLPWIFNPCASKPVVRLLLLSTIVKYRKVGRYQ